MNANINKLITMKSEVSTYIFEREKELEAILICLLTNKHGFFLGKPGLAKSEMVNYVAAYFKDGKYFYNNCHSYITPNELVGPMDIMKLKSGIQERIIDNHLVTADIACLDEVFKAQKQLSSLLPVLNERIFVQNGTKIKCPLISAFLVSNELPGDKELEAFFNRVLFRFEVQPLQLQENRLKVMKKEMLPAFNPSFSMTLDELKQAQKDVKSVKLPLEIVMAADEIFQTIRAEGLYQSDRTQGWIITPLQAYAALQGRDTVEIEDLGIIADIAWRSPEERPVIVKIVNAISNQELDAILAKVDAVQKIFSDWQKAGQGANHKETVAQIKLVGTELDMMKPKKRNTDDYNKAKAKIGEITRVIAEVAKNMMMRGN
jgi:MoxR-like ATPase